RKHEFVDTLPKEPVWVAADAARLTQVITNLLNNAAKYTPERGHIWLSLQKEGSHAVITVGDDGIGITSDMLPRVFDLFAQSPRAQGEAPGGLGIGLTLVKKLVEMHGGTVQALSEGPGKGSRFIVRIPAIESPTMHAGNAGAVPSEARAEACDE